LGSAHLSGRRINCPRGIRWETIRGSATSRRKKNASKAQHCDSYNLQRKYLFENPKILNIMDRAADDLGIRNPLLKAMEGAARTLPH